MLKGKYIVLLFFIALAVILLPDISAIAEAAAGGGLTPSYNNAYINQGVGLKTFDSGFTKFVTTILHLMRPIVTILTAVAGLQIAFGISDGKKTVWNWILGAGLAISFADFVYSSSMFQTLIENGTEYKAAVPEYKISNSIDSDILSDFMKFYKEQIIFRGAEAIKGICIKLLLILMTINCSMKLALDLISGDKIKFLITEVLKAGFYIFLIVNWIGPSGMDLTGYLSNGFQEIGFIAGGDPNAKLNPDSIWSNGVELLHAMLSTMLEMVRNFQFADAILMIIVFCVSCYCVIMTSIEMFMVRIEFLTMALLSMPLLAFAMIEQFNFLSQKAINAVFNLAMKCCVIAFIQSIILPFFKVMKDQVISVNETATLGGLAKHTLKGDVFQTVSGSFMAFITLMLGLIIILILTKKIPALVTGLLNGSPSLSGGDMSGMAMGAVSRGAHGIATTAGVLMNMPGGESGGKGSGGGKGDDNDNATKLTDLNRSADNLHGRNNSNNGGFKEKAAMTFATAATGGAGGALTAAKEVGKEGAKEVGKDAMNQANGSTQGNQTGNGNTGQARSEQKSSNAEGASANRNDSERSTNSKDQASTTNGNAPGSADTRSGEGTAGNNVPEHSADGNAQAAAMDGKDDGASTMNGDAHGSVDTRNGDAHGSVDTRNGEGTASSNVPERSADGNAQAAAMNGNNANRGNGYRFDPNTGKIYKDGSDGKAQEAGSDSKNEIPSGSSTGVTNQGNYQPQDMAEKMNKAKNKEDDKAEDKANEASEQTAGNGDNSNGASEQSANTDTNVGSIRQNAPQAASGGNGGQSQSQPGRSGSTRSSGGRQAAYLAKALLMSTPAGSLLKSYEKGRGLAGDFDKAVGNNSREADSPRDQLLNLVIEDYSRRLTEEHKNE